MTDIYKEAFEFLKTKELFNQEHSNFYSETNIFDSFWHFSSSIEHTKDRIEAKNRNCVWFGTFWLS